MPLQKRLLIVAPIMSLLLALIAFSAKFMIGDIYFWKVYYPIQRAADAVVYPSESEILQMRQDLERALWWDKNAEYYDVMAFVIHYQIMQAQTSAEQISYAQESVAYSRRATYLRPYWPQGQAYLASGLAYSGQLGDEFDVALRRAMEYGPWDYENLLAISRFGIPLWWFLNEEQKVVIVQSVAHGIQTGRPYIRPTQQLIESFHMQRPICDALKQAGEDATSLCRRWRLG